MINTAANTYDEVAYPSYPFPQSHPDRLATLATLFGLNPARIDDCRVLEIGCGDGANLIPMALQLPGSQFVGVDLAAAPIARGEALAARLRLGNLTLRQFDILELSAEFGQFDYVIAHGVYSWVPTAVRDKLLAICKANLTANGVAYVSYNTYPGSHLRQMMREMMLFHVRDIQPPGERINQARALARFLAGSHCGPEAYKAMLASLEQEVGRLEDGSLYHDLLEAVNAPVYFHQFIAHARRHGLQYLSEADFFDMQAEALAPPAADALRRIGDEDPLAREQYLDFLTCRRFRQTLLCHEDVAVDRTLRPERVMSLFVASPARPVSEAPVIDTPSVEAFEGHKGAVMSTNHPLTKTAVLELGRFWPGSVRFKDLLAAARSALSPSLAQQNGDIARDDARRLGEFLLQAYGANLVELHAHPSQFVLAASERPVASRLTRLQLETGTTVTTLRHTSVKVMDAIGRQLLMLLDGSRDREALLKELNRLVVSGEVVVRREGKAVSDAQQALRLLADELDQNLNRLARLALLVA